MLTLYIMCGLPFSGKTTLAKQIAEKTDAKMIAFDWIWAEKKRELTPDVDKVEEWKFILREAYIRIRENLLSGNSVVYDDINVRKEHRDVLRKIASACNASFTIIYLNTTMKTIRERETRNKTFKERHDVASVNFEKALAQWETPTSEEGVRKYKPDQNFNDWLLKL